MMVQDRNTLTTKISVNQLKKTGSSINKEYTTITYYMLFGMLVNIK